MSHCFTHGCNNCIECALQKQTDALINAITSEKVRDNELPEEQPDQDGWLINIFSVALVLFLGWCLYQTGHLVDMLVRWLFNA